MTRQRGKAGQSSSPALTTSAPPSSSPLQPQPCDAKSCANAPFPSHSSPALSPRPSPLLLSTLTPALEAFALSSHIRWSESAGTHCKVPWGKMTAMESMNATLALIPQYTGLSVGTFFTIIALVVGIYYLISGLFAPPPVKYIPREPLPPPTQLGEITAEELQQYDGTDPSKPLLMAIKAQIYDVSQSRAFYGPDGPYALFAGKDASRALAKMSFEEKDLTGDIEGLSPYEAEALTDWEYKFMSKYVKVGTVKPGPASSTKAEDLPTESAAGEETAAAQDTEPEASKDE